MSKDFINLYSKKYSSPYDVQKLIKSFEYNREKQGETLKSANEALKTQRAHCLEAAFIAAALLEKRGHPPLVISFESVDCLDHVIYIFKTGKKWGSIGHSRDEGLSGRKAIFKNPRELAKSYIDPYVDISGRIKAFAVVNLNDCKGDWRYSKRNVWRVEKHLIHYPHRRINCTNAHYKKLHDAYMSGRLPQKKHYWL